MSYRDERYRRRAQKRTRIAAIVALVLLVEIIVMVVLLSRGCSSRRGTPDVTSQQTAPVTAETPVPADTTEPTEEPTLVPTPSPTPTAQSYAVDGYLPVYRKLDTKEKVIAITVDDLAQPANLKKICQLAKDYNARLTLFPVGTMLENDENRETVRRAYYELGFEIENHTYGHDKLYMLSDTEMAESIFKQQQLVSDILGVDYQMHFLRMPGGIWSMKQKIQWLRHGRGLETMVWSSVSPSGCQSSLRTCSTRVCPSSPSTVRSKCR